MEGHPLLFRTIGGADGALATIVHVALFTIWMLSIESKPWPTLALIVSLERSPSPRLP